MPIPYRCTDTNADAPRLSRNERRISIQEIDVFFSVCRSFPSGGLIATVIDRDKQRTLARKMTFATLSFLLLDRSDKQSKNIVRDEIRRRISLLPHGQYSVWPYWAQSWLETGPPAEFHEAFLEKAKEDETLFSARKGEIDIHPAEYLNL